MFGEEPRQVNHWSRANTVSPSSETEAGDQELIQDIGFLTKLRHEQEINFWSHKDTGPGPNGDPSSWSTSRQQAFSVVCVYACVTLRNCGALSPKLSCRVPVCIMTLNLGCLFLQQWLRENPRRAGFACKDQQCASMLPKPKTTVLPLSG